MKKIILLLVGCYFSNLMNAQQIADSNFADAVRDYCPSCIDSNNRITTDGKKLTSLTIAIRNINDLTGINGFSSLNSLNCGNNNLTFLPILPSGLKTLHISQNQLTNLDNLPTGLINLYCKGNKIKVLPKLPTNLQILDCSDNLLTILPDLPISLRSLLCTNNSLSSIPALPNALEGLVCANNRLISLPKLPPFLTFLSCQNNNNLVCLPRLPDSLTYLYISKNIACLPNKVEKAEILTFDGIVSQKIKVPQCSDLAHSPCPPLPKDTIITVVIPKISIFPNPTEGVLNIKHTGVTILSVSVFNYLGQLVRQVEGNRYVLELNDLAAGWYFVKVKTNIETVTQKVIKQ